jgi:type IV secretion system protein VirD4
VNPAGGRGPSRSTGVTAGLSPIELVAAYAMGLLLIGTGWMWTTAQLSTFATSGSWLPMRLGQAAPVTLSIWQEPGSPAAAFPAEVAEQVAGPFVFWPTAVVLLAGLLSPLLWWLGRQAQGGSEDGGARWATARDLAPLVVPRTTPGRLTLGEGPGRRLLATEPGHSLLVVGPTQSGKTSGLAIPAILEWPGPVVATSVKADLLNDTIDARQRHGRVWVYDPSASVSDIDRSTWTPLAGCDTWRGALRTASWMAQAARDRQLGENDFWSANAAKLLAPLLFAARAADLSISDVVRWVDVQDTDEVALLLKLTGNEEALAAATASWKRDERTKSSVYTTAETVLAAYADPQVGASAASCDIDTTRLFDGDAHTLYVAAPLHEQARLRPLFTTLVQTVLAVAYEKAAAKGRLDPPLLLVLDEAANIAPLRDLAQIASTAAGLGIQLVTVWQDRAQIVHRYGDAADTVVNNHRAKLLLSGITDSRTTTELANLIGETSVTRRSTTVDADGRTSATHGTQNQPLTSAAGLRQLRPFEGVLIYGHLPPARIRLRPWFRHASRRGRSRAV